MPQYCPRTAAAFRKIVLGKLRLTDSLYKEPGPSNNTGWQRASSPPFFSKTQIERLRTMLSRAGIDPVQTGGLPPLETPQFNPPSNTTYKTACREFK